MNKEGILSQLRSGFPRQVWVLGLVSLLMDMSSEIIHAILPVFLVSHLGLSMLVLGIIEGAAEAIAQISKIFSGMISDYFARRKPLLLLGYGLAAVTKPLFPLASSASYIVIARFIDRLGKGIRGAPRDALIADVTLPSLRGAAFGLRQSLDTCGAFLGPLIAIGCLWWSEDAIRLVLWLAIIPAMLSFSLLFFGLNEPERARSMDKRPDPLRRGMDFSPGFWLVIILGACLALARFSEAFLIIRANQAGLDLTFIPLVIVVMSGVYALSAYPAGFLADRFSLRLLLGTGLGVLIVADMILSWASGIGWIFAGIGFWGLHMGLTQGLLAALIAETSLPPYYGTAFGIFNFISGLFTLLGSGLAGLLWQEYGHEAAFLTSAGLSLVCLLLLAISREIIGRPAIRS